MLCNIINIKSITYQIFTYCISRIKIESFFWTLQIVKNENSQINYKTIIYILLLLGAAAFKRERERESVESDPHANGQGRKEEERNDVSVSYFPSILFFYEIAILIIDMPLPCWRVPLCLGRSARVVPPKAAPRGFQQQAAVECTNPW